MSDDEQEEKSGADKLNEAARPTVQDMINIKEVDSSQIGQLKPVLDEERKLGSPVIDKSHEGAREAAQDAGLQEVDLFQSEQFRPMDTPPGVRDEVTPQPKPDPDVSQDGDLVEQSLITAHSEEMASILAFVKEDKQMGSELEKAVQARQDQAESERKNRAKEQEQQRIKGDDNER